MKHRFLSLLATLMTVVVLVTGCGGSDANTSVGSPTTTITPVVTQAVQVGPVSATLTAAAPLQLSTSGGASVRFTSAQVQQDTLVTLTQHTSPPQQPRDTTTTLSGPAATLTFGATPPVGAFQVTLPHTISDVNGTFVGYFVNGIFVPADTTVDAANNQVTASVDLQVLKAAGTSPSSVTFAVAENFSFLPAHVYWQSYNVYYYSNGTFQKIIALGKPVAAIPDLGSKPAVIIHGFGSSIGKQQFNSLAASLLNQGTATGVIGFEYDTLDSIANNGEYLNQALAQYQAAHGTQKWQIVAHSMGGLVSRVFLEQTSHSGISNSGNRLVTLCTPNSGSPVANKLTSNLNDFQKFFRYVVLNSMMDFTNSDGRRSQVPLDAPGIANLQVGNAYLTILNTNPDQNHPEASYFAVGGVALSLEYAILDIVVGVTTDDGLVLLPSAIYLPLCLADARKLLVDHSSVVSSPLTFSAVTTFITEQVNPICLQQIP